MRDLVKQQFGNLTVIDNGGKDYRNCQLWICQCKCGTIKSFREWDLMNRSKSCGCVKKTKFRTSLLGKRIGKLQVISFSHISKRATFWRCQCDCGNECVARGTSLINHTKRSCGCLINVTGKESPNFKGYEGISSTQWTRIRNGSQHRGRHYDKKIEFNITIQEAWNLFLTQNGKCALTGMTLQFPSKSELCDGTASLDRIDSSKGYVTGNVQWVHKDINFMKGVYDQNYFVEMCKKVVDKSQSGDMVDV